MIPNVRDARTITAYTHYLAMSGQAAGNLRFDGHSEIADETQVAEQCRWLCNKISSCIAACKESDIPDLLECYDIVYRIGNKCMPDRDFISRNNCRVLKFRVALEFNHKNNKEYI